jgi:putative transposase
MCWQKTVTPSRRRTVASYWHDTYRVSERRACRVARLPVSTFRYESRQEPRTALRLRIREIAQTRLRYGYRKNAGPIEPRRLEGGKKLVYRSRRCSAARRFRRGLWRRPPGTDDRSVCYCF